MAKIPNTVISDSTFNSDIEYKDGSKSEGGIARQNARNAKTYADFSNIFNHQFTLDQRARQFETDSAIVAIQREQLRDGYVAQMRNRDIQMNAQLEAYGASADQTAQQLKFNTEAGKQAYTSAEAQYLDRLKGIDFAVKGQRINNLEQFSNLASQYQDTVDSIGFQEDIYKTATENANDVFLESIRSTSDRETLIGDIADRDELEQRTAANNRYKIVKDNFANEETEALRNIGQNNINSLAALKNQTKEATRSSLAQRTELIRSAGFDSSEIIRSAGFNSSELIRSSGVEAEQLTTQANAQAQELVTSTANQRTIITEAAKEKKKEGFRAAAARRALAKQGNRLESDSRLAEVKNTIQNERAKLNVQANQQQLQQLISTGSTSAKGGRGTSTQRALQTLGLLGSVNQAQLVSDFTRFKGQQEGVTERIQRAAGIANAQADEAELAAQNQLRNMLSELDAEQTEAMRAASVRSEQIKTSARDRAQELKTAARAKAGEIKTAARAKAGEIKTASRARAKEMEISTREQNQNLTTELKAANKERLKNVQNVMSERERFGLAQAGESKRAAKQSAKDRQKTLKEEAAENRKSAVNQALLTQDSIFDQAADRVSFERNRTATQQAAINERSNIMRMRTELTLEELGTSMLSATSAFQQAKGRIFMDKFEADAAAIANMMAKPEFADAPKTPFVIPDPEFVLPPLPIEAPKNAIPIPPQQSGLSKALQIGGVVLGAAATALTMGTAAGIVGPLAAPIVGGFGAAATGTSELTY